MPQPSRQRRRLLERLNAGGVIRLPPWSTRIQLISVGYATSYLATPTFRALLRHGWVVRAGGANDQVPSYRLSEAGKRLLEPTPVHIDPSRSRPRGGVQSTPQNGCFAPAGRSASKTFST